MAFDLVVHFMGICALVPDQAPNPGKFCVLLPHAYFEDDRQLPNAADATKLRRHRPMVRFSLLNVPGVNAATQPDATVVWYLEKQRLTFVPTGGPATLSVRNLDEIIDVGQVAPRFNSVDPRHLGWGVTDRGVCQVMFDRGDLAEVNPLAELWTFPNTLSGTHLPNKSISSEITLTMQGLTGLELLARPLSGGPTGPGASRRPLTAPDGATIHVEIAHLCDENPLRWARAFFNRVPDPDFKWYFELLDKTPNSDYNKLIVALNSLELPIPMPVGGGPNGQGVNCPPAKMAPTPFTLD